MKAGLAGGGGAAAAAAGAGSATSGGGAGRKQAAPDLTELATAMVRAAAARPARELSAAVTDLPAPVPELQARLSAAVEAEHESELRALRALYSSGSLRRLQREGVVLVGLGAQPGGRLYRSNLWRFGLLPGADRRHAAAAGAAALPLPYHKFRPGASVIITRHEGEGASAAGGGGGGKSGGGGGAAVGVDAETGLPADGVEGVVVEAHKDHLVVALEGRANDTFQAMVATAAEMPLAAGAARRGAGSGRGGGGGPGSPFLGWRLDQSVRDTTTRRHLEGIKRLGAWAESAVRGRGVVD
ncbi:hypothetical protein GPECTOR_26g490 [Gonium pectorale]|uniref:Uncharacterized protein n=1 Tax=Gonium pectorale TaxID=33097 RepID=A0A150GFF5_GONPE|nr:hypothetical protein GPECTOR_26g490 [Gonium pectorale]|eukprot:KXZ48587.1 hypothetical protein GPECTOR_26g490 [Gonium pectorale]